MGELSHFRPEIGQPSSKKYWETDLDAHRLLGAEKAKSERYKVFANKVHYLIEQGIFKKYDEKGNDFEMELFAAFAKNEQGFKSNLKYRKINKYIGYLDLMQEALDSKVNLFRSPIENINDLTEKLKELENQSLDNETKITIQEQIDRFEKVYYERINLKKAA